MAANNAIGTGALILTANADQMVSGIDKALSQSDKLVNDYTKRFDKATGSWTAKPLGGAAPGQTMLNRLIFGTGEFDAQSGQYLGRVGGLVNNIKGVVGAASKGGGLLGSLLGIGGSALGGAVGGPLGALLGGGLSQLLNPKQFLNGIRDQAESVRPNTSGADAGALDSMSASITQVNQALDKLTTKFLVALAPAATDACNVILAALDHFSPLLDKIAEGFTAVTEVGVSMGALVLGGIMEIVDNLASWLGRLGTLVTGHESMTSGIIAALRPVGIAVAYVWDVFKAGAGVFALLEGLHKRMIGSILSGMAELAKTIPAEMRPDWANDLIRAGEKAGSFFTDLGHSLQDWGTDAILNFGSSADKVRKLFDNLGGHIDQKKKDFADLGKNATMSLKLAGANQANSKEAYSVMAQYSAQGRDLADIQRANLKAVEQGNQFLQGILDEQKKARENAIRLNAL